MPESFLKPQKLTLCQIEYTILRDESAISKYLNRFRRGGKELENKSTYPESPQKDRRRHRERVGEQIHISGKSPKRQKETCKPGCRNNDWHLLLRDYRNARICKLSDNYPGDQQRN